MNIDINTLAERELDILVAEHVLGYSTVKVKPDWYPHEVTCFYREGAPLMAYSYDKNACNAMMYANGVDASAGNAQSLPHFSSDDGSEWEIVDAMIGTHQCWFRLNGFDTSYRHKEGIETERVPLHREYEVEFKPKDYRGTERFIAIGETPQIAICRAALKACLRSKAANA